MVQDWLIPAMASGRPVLTNIRGVASSDLIAVVSSGDIVADMFKVAIGTLVLIDELGECFRNVDIKKASFPDSVLYSDENGTRKQITDIATLFDKHRHFNLDIIGTAPGIKRVPDDFKALAEFGYKHKNLKSLGFGGFFLQGQHNGFDNGTSDKDFLSKKIKRIKKATFAAYQSTATGQVKDSAISTPIWKHPVFLFISLLIMGAIYNVSTTEYSTPIMATPSSKSPDATGQTPNANHASASPNASDHASGAASGAAPYTLAAAENAPSLDLLSDPPVSVMGRMDLKDFVYFTVGNCDVQRTIKLGKGIPSESGFFLQANRLWYRSAPVSSRIARCPLPVDQPNTELALSDPTLSTASQVAK
jgi:zona occludens toxin